ncbi:MAG: DNA polymerase I [bacterium]
MAEKNPKKLFLIDGSALAYRSHFAFIQNPLINSRGENTSAIFGFVRTVFQIQDGEQPDYLGVVFDTKEPTFRHKTYPAYKATREKMPDEMRAQLPKLREVIEALGLPIIELPGYEADDVLATLALKAKAQNIDVFLATADKDLMQVISPGIKMFSLRRSGVEVDIFDSEAVKAKMGVLPEQIIDYLALVGDTSDNVPGVPRVGKKTAITLLEQFGSLEDILDGVSEITKNAIRESLLENIEQARLSQRLVTLETNAPIELDLDALSGRGIEQDKVIELFHDLEFSSLLERFSVEKEEEIPAAYHTIRDKKALLNLIEMLKNAGRFTFDLETTSQFPVQAEIVGFSFSCEERVAYYVPVKAPQEGAQPFTSLELGTADGEVVDLISALKPILTDPTIPKNGQNAKYDIIVLASYGIHVAGLAFDTMVASYLLNPTSRQHNLDALALEHFNFTKVPTSDLIGKGKKQITMREVPMEKVAYYACEDADITERLRAKFEPRLKSAGLGELFQKVEMPLVNVLVKVERWGVKLDLPYLSEMSIEMQQKLDGLQSEIYALAGEEFNINSPKQLGQILFEKHKMPVIKKTKTGVSTDAAVLEKLAVMHGYELPKKMIDYREIAKLKSTYVDALPRMVNPYTGRLHTSYNQTVAATGRLSSSDPNLQNIPIRTEIGREIRKAFIPEDSGWKFLDADYSQIELRVMAHLSKDKNLIEAFREGKDIHQTTAARVFGVVPDDVTPELRRRAKEINFGIMYGMGVYGLSNRLNISQHEAQSIITEYFVKYPGVNDFIIGTLADARKNGYVTTLLNRRRYLPEIRSENRNIREFAERTAINTPIQGTAADMIKLAMIGIMDRFEEENLQSRMIMQVHDELVFEVPQEEIPSVQQIVRSEMENALHLDVPIRVEMGVGENWLDAH